MDEEEIIDSADTYDEFEALQRPIIPNFVERGSTKYADYVEKRKKSFDVASWRVWDKTSQKYLSMTEFLEKIKGKDKGYVKWLSIDATTLMQDFIFGLKDRIDGSFDLLLEEFSLFFDNYEDLINFASASDAYSKQSENILKIMNKELESTKKELKEVKELLNMLLNYPDQIPEIREKMTKIKVRDAEVVDAVVKVDVKRKDF